MLKKEPEVRKKGFEADVLHAEMKTDICDKKYLNHLPIGAVFNVFLISGNPMIEGCHVLIVMMGKIFGWFLMSYCFLHYSDATF